MSTKTIVQLAPRSVAFYDRETNIHLTLSDPRGEIPEGAELKNIKNGLDTGTIVLAKGSLDGESIPDEKENQETTEQQDEPENSRKETDEKSSKEGTPEDEEGSTKYTYEKLNEMYVKDLKEIAKDTGIAGYSNMIKEELIKALLEEF